MKVTISILLATYNGEKYLPQLLASLEAQTYPPLELVCCDDVSTDGTLGILEEFATRSKIQVKIFQNKNNKGYVKNFLEGFSLCSGDYVALCDQDDVWKPEKLEAMAARIKPDLTPSMVFSDAELVDSQMNSLKSTAIGFSKITSIEKEKIKQGDLLEILIEHPLIPGMCMLVHRERCLINSPNDSCLKHDYALSAGFSIGGDYSFIDTCLVFYRQHETNAIGMKNSEVAKKRKRRGSFWTQSYAENANSDLYHNFNLINYLINFKTKESLNIAPHKKILEDHMSFAIFRNNRRLSCWALLFEKPPENIRVSQKQQRKLYLKDLRVYCRCKINKLIWRIINFLK
jgi:glycosyltransferase involved in cell wall biosynthesis